MIQVGRLGQADVDAAAGILFDAFGAAYRRRGHAPPFPTRESAAWLCRAYIDLDPEGCALARSASEIVGVGFAHPRGAVTSIGPLASRPGAPAGVARALMSELGGIAAGSSSVRLFQDSFNPDSFGLYTRLGYVVSDVAPYLLAEKLEPPAATDPRVRPLVAADLPVVERYDRARTGADRRRDLALLASTRRGLHLPGGGARRDDRRIPVFPRASRARRHRSRGGRVGRDAGGPGRRGRGQLARPSRRDPCLSRRAGDAQAGVRSRVSRRSPREPHGARAVCAAPGAALRAVPGKSLNAVALALPSH